MQTYSYDVNKLIMWNFGNSTGLKSQTGVWRT